MSKRTGLLGMIAAALLLTFAGTASAATEWRITSSHGPQNMAPGDGSTATTEGQYVIQVFNVGDTNSDASTVTLTDTLPAGVVATAAYGQAVFGADWDCSGTAFPAAVVTCQYTGSVLAPGATDPTPGAISSKLSGINRGAANPLLINVSVPANAAGTLDNVAEVSGGGAPSASTAVDPTPFTSTPAGFGFVPGSYAADLFDAESPAGGVARQAGSHPFEMRVDFRVNLLLGNDPDHNGNSGTENLYFTSPEGHMKTIETKLPPGLIGNPQAAPQCPPERMNDGGSTGKGECPIGSQVGVIDLLLNQGKQLRVADPLTDVPVYNMIPPRGAVAALAFQYLGNPVYLIASVDPADNHSIVTRISNTISLLNTRSVSLTLWGVPADPAHDPLRINPTDGSIGGEEAMSTPSNAPVAPFLTLPAQCERAGAIQMRVDSWQHPGAFTPWSHGMAIQASGCDDPRMRFEPTISIQPTSRQAASPTGLDIDLSIPQKRDSFQSSDAAANAANAAKLYAQSGNDAAVVTPNVRDAVTRLPLGMAVNPSVADGLTGCSAAQVGLDNNNDPTCPDSSKIGTVEIDSQLMGQTMTGSIYQAKQNENPFGSTLAFYTVAKAPGLIIKLAAKVESDPQTGQLTTIFEDNPQLAFSHYRLHFNGGPRAPLVNPPTCGTYASTAAVSSWNSSVPVANVGDSFQIVSGPNGTPCPNGLAGRPFNPSFSAGSTNPIAGAYSTFALDVSRADGTQELRGIETTLPPGLTGKLAGIPYCPEAAIASISTAPGSGLGQRLAPSCPAASLVGHSDAAAGAGSLPFHNPGSVYLAGPYKGAPLSLAIVTPIVAGPLDLGSVVVRAALHVDPVTTRIRVVSDPIPDRIVADGNGFPLNVRSVRVAMDRPGFTLNPTSCEAMSVSGTITSLQGARADVSDRFQVGACAALAFKPKLGLRLKGGTRRSAHPALTATLTARGGDANLARAAVALPRSIFLAQNHIRTVCTRVQFAADACPAGSVYGYATAWSPLLDSPLQGPVYLRSSDNPLPDLVAALHGQVDVDLAGRIDSVRGGIRTTFDLVPDVPVSRFVLKMKGGKRGLLENSRDLCARRQFATAAFDAHNGRVADLRPRLRAGCGKGHR